VDATVAHPSRVWNFWLGGHDYFKADRVSGAALAQEFPHLPHTARAERAFLVRATRYLAGPARIRQFLDLGAGLPAGGNTHEIAQRIAADTGVVYVDNDPVVLAHAKALLDGPAGADSAIAMPAYSGTGLAGAAARGGALAGLPASVRGAGPAGLPRTGPVTYVDADLRDVSAVLAGAGSTLDLGRPVAVMMLGVLGFIEDLGVARSITSQLLAALPPGSYLAVADSVSTSDEVNRGQLRYNQRTGAPYHLRKPDELASVFAGLNLVEPGLVPCAQWKPDTLAPPKQDEVPVYCGLGRKP
jgi:S-adenosyl methyltransferase